MIHLLARKRNGVMKYFPTNHAAVVVAKALKVSDLSTTVLSHLKQLGIRYSIQWI